MSKRTQRFNFRGQLWDCGHDQSILNKPRIGGLMKGGLQNGARMYPGNIDRNWLADRIDEFCPGLPKFRRRLLAVKAANFLSGGKVTKLGGVIMDKPEGFSSYIIDKDGYRRHGEIAGPKGKLPL
jgi:hypothetical protein